jgi:hypothetical protein
MQNLLANPAVPNSKVPSTCSKQAFVWCYDADVALFGLLLPANACSYPAALEVATFAAEVSDHLDQQQFIQQQHLVTLEDQQHQPAVAGQQDKQGQQPKLKRVKQAQQQQ